MYLFIGVHSIWAKRSFALDFPRMGRKNEKYEIINILNSDFVWRMQLILK